MNFWNWDEVERSDYIVKTFLYEEKNNNTRVTLYSLLFNEFNIFFNFSSTYTYNNKIDMKLNQKEKKINIVYIKFILHVIKIFTKYWKNN